MVRVVHEVRPWGSKLVPREQDRGTLEFPCCDDTARRAMCDLGLLASRTERNTSWLFMSDSVSGIVLQET